MSARAVTDRAYSLLDDCSVRKYAVLGHDHDSIANVITGSVEMMDSLLVQDSNVNPDVRIFVDDRIADGGTAADSDVWNSELPVVVLVLFVFIIVGAHHQRSFECDVFADHAANSHDGVRDTR